MPCRGFSAPHRRRLLQPLSAGRSPPNPRASRQSGVKPTRPMRPLIGRTEVLEALTAFLEEQPIAVLTGLAGAGKTAVVAALNRKAVTLKAPFEPKQLALELKRAERSKGLVVLDGVELSTPAE